MREELQQQLFEKYPDLFARRSLPMNQTCMCWGIETGDGWYDLLDTLCEYISVEVKYNKAPPVQFEQVKEKFGGLRVYTTGGNKEIQGAISLASMISYKTCEDCGVPATVRTTGWIRNLCTSCHEKDLERMKRPSRYAGSDDEV